MFATSLRQAKVATKNIIFAINGKTSDKITFDYRTKGLMTLIGKRNDAGNLFDHKVHGFTAWWLQCLYYLGNLPTVERNCKLWLIGT